MGILKPFAKPTWVENDAGVMMPSRRAILLTSADASVGLTFTDLDNAEDPAGVGATEVDLSAASGGLTVTDGTTTVAAKKLTLPPGTVTDGGGGNVDIATGLVPDTYYNSVSGAEVTINPGEATTVYMVTATPPSWMDNAGNIIETGLYQGLLYFQSHTVGTATNKFALCVGGFAAVHHVPLDALAELYTISSTTTPEDIGSMATNNLPFNPGWTVGLPADATGWQITVQATLIRLAH